MDSEVKRVEPLFFLNNEVEQEQKWLDTLEVCLAICSVVADETHVEGAQRIGGLWRNYLTNPNTRTQLLCTGFNLRGIQIDLKDKNPFLHTLGREDFETTRVYVRNIPLSFDNGEIEKVFRSKKIEMVSPIKYVRARTKEGKLTNFKTGDRFVDVVIPSEPLPKKVQIGIWNASIYHKEQKQIKNDIECGNCKGKGHVMRDCPNEPFCYDRLQSGHIKGSPLCPVTEQMDMNGEESEDSEDSQETADTETAGKDSSRKEVKKQATSDEAKASTQNVGQQPLISHLFRGKENSPVGSPIGSPTSSPRVRRMGDRSPDDIPNAPKQRKKKK